MAVSGFPLVLENIISAVLESYEVGNWNIFNEKSGDITIRIRFKNQGEGQNSVQPVQNMSYRKKSTAQVNRDRSRAAKRQRQSSSGISNGQSPPETARNFSENECLHEEYQPGEDSIAFTDQDLDQNCDSPVVRHSLCFQPQINEMDSFSELDPWEWLIEGSDCREFESCKEECTAREEKIVGACAHAIIDESIEIVKEGKCEEQRTQDIRRKKIG